MICVGETYYMEEDDGFSPVRQVATGHFIYPSGVEEWYKDGMPHREDGPALIFPYGDECWMQKGANHRRKGPATIWAGGEEEWWYKGIKMPPNYTKLDIVKGKIGDIIGDIKWWFKYELFP